MELSISPHGLHAEEEVQEWLRSGALTEWCADPDGLSLGQPVYRGQPAMTSIAKDLAQGLDVRLGLKVTAIRSREKGWMVELEGSERLFASSLIVTAPVPQTLDLLDAGETLLPEWQRQRMAGVKYDKCFAVMAILKEPSALPAPGYLKPIHGPVAWLADKGCINDDVFGISLA